PRALRYRPGASLPGCAGRAEGGPKAHPLDVVCVPATPGLRPFLDGYFLRHPLTARGARLFGAPGAGHEARTVHSDRHRPRKWITPRDIRFAGRHEVPIVNDVICSRCGRSGQSLLQSPRSLVRWYHGCTNIKAFGSGWPRVLITSSGTVCAIRVWRVRSEENTT